MPEKERIRRLDQRPLKEAIATRGRSIIPGLTKDELIKWFFAANAFVAIVVLGLIMLSLFDQSINFFPKQGFFGQSYRNLLVYREAGLEFVDLIKNEVAGIDDLSQRLAVERLAALKRLLKTAKTQGKSEENALTDANAALAPFDEYAGKVSSLADPLSAKIGELGDGVIATKTQVKIQEDRKAEKELYLSKGKRELADKVVLEPVDLQAAVKPLRDALPGLREANDKLAIGLREIANQVPPVVDDTMRSDLLWFKARVNIFADSIPAAQTALENWSPTKPLPWYAGVVSFFFYPDWLTASAWQDYYGILPLLVGSALISLVALLIAVPLGVGAGIYVNQIATPWEQNLIKPYIEFISAIPSVVLGFFGVAILGTSLIWLSRQGYLPQFSERLNVVTAGILLAFMAIPTIFTLTEDAINNVPRAFKEASYALGANRLQTIWRIILPAALSGVISAILLGFGRVIGETMVVLLCAGNRIAIPPLSDGLKIIFQPVHTMTGIIAQELGEAENGSIQWRGLFMVGLLLFLISLVINYLAQQVVKRFKISIG